MVNLSKRRIFYSSFFHGHMFRDYRHIYYDKTSMFDFPDKALDTQEMKKQALNFLNAHTSCNWLRNGILSALLSFFNDIGAYRVNNDDSRFTDRLMFDFDSENIEEKVE